MRDITFQISLNTTQGDVTHEINISRTYSLLTKTNPITAGEDRPAGRQAGSPPPSVMLHQALTTAASSSVRYRKRSGYCFRHRRIFQNIPVSRVIGFPSVQSAVCTLKQHFMLFIRIMSRSEASSWFRLISVSSLRKILVSNLTLLSQLSNPLNMKDPHLNELRSLNFTQRVST